MKKLITIFAGIALLASACKKDEPVYMTSSTINVINMAVDGPSVKVNPGANSSFVWSKATNLVAYGASNVYSAFTGNRTIIAVSASDTTQTLFNKDVNLQQIVNTLYITGQSPAIEGFFVEEKNLPFIQKDIVKPDSSIYVRFVNLSPNSTPLNIKLTTGAGNEVTGLAYKGISEFKKYDARVGTNIPVSYIFEVRDVATNNVKATFTLPVQTNRFKTISLVIKGLLTTPATTGTNAFGVTQVNYF